jgi:hypothetical protein
MGLDLDLGLGLGRMCSIDVPPATPPVLSGRFPAPVEGECGRRVLFLLLDRESDKEDDDEVENDRFTVSDLPRSRSFSSCSSSLNNPIFSFPPSPTGPGVGGCKTASLGSDIFSVQTV